MYLAISNTLSSIAMNISRLARDMWNSISLNDVWERELRKWEDII